MNILQKNPDFSLVFFANYLFFRKGENLKSFFFEGVVGPTLPRGYCQAPITDVNISFVDIARYVQRQALATDRRRENVGLEGECQQ